MKGTMNNTATIYLVRHAQYSNPHKILPGRLPVPLSKVGKQEAENLKIFFKTKNIEKIYSSAVLRCKQTSEIISDSQIPIIYDQRLLETFSAYQGYWIEDWSLFFSMQDELGGETNTDIQNRIVHFFETTKFKKNKNYIICSHGDPLYFLYQHLAKQPLLVQDQLSVAENYQEKGSIRELTIHSDGTVTIHTILTNSQLL